MKRGFAMKRNLIKGLCAFGCSIMLVGCSELNSSGTGGANEQEIRDKLSNAKIENISSYSELGYVSKSSESKNASDNKNDKKRSRVSRPNYMESASRWYLAGLIGDEVTGLNTESGDSFWDIPIRTYHDLGAFIGFSPDYNKDEMHDWYDLQYSSGCGILDYSECEYLLSKKSGKIYKTRDYTNDGDGNWRGWDLSNLIAGKNMFYAFYSYDSCQNNGSNNGSCDQYCYWACIEEENEQLVIKKSSMLEFIGEDKLRSEDCCYDTYGNILIGDTVYGYNQREFDSNLEGRLPYGYEPYTHTIYTYCNDSFYVLEGLEFKKYDNVIFGYGFGSSWNYYYYAESKDSENWKIGYNSEDWFDAHSLYYPYVNETGETIGYNSRSYSAIGDFYIYTMEMPSIEHEYNDYFLVGDDSCGFGVYKQLDKYTFLPIDFGDYGKTNLSHIHSGSITREEFVYYINENYKFMKLNFINDDESEIDTGGYKIKEISKDSLGNIIVSGYDSSFQEFTGYLDENDTVTFTPTNKSNGGYDVIYMSPIN